MSDLSTTTAGKSDQINADMFIGGQTLTIKVTQVEVKPGTEQPVTIHYEGENGRPFKPCLSMRRLLIHVWGNDGNAYAGRSMVLYNDPKVTFGPVATGGIRISHVSHIDGPMTVALTEKKGSRKPFTVKPLIVATEAPATPTREQYTAIADASKEAGVTSADLLSHFGLSKMSGVTVAMLPEVMAWIEAQKTTQDLPT